MHWLTQRLFDQLTRVDLGRASFFDRFRAMDPETRSDLLADLTQTLTRRGRLGISADGTPQGHFSLMLIWNHQHLPETSETADLDALMPPMNADDEEMEGERDFR